MPPADHMRPWAWIVIAGVLAAGVIGLAIYSIDLNADLDAANAEIASQQRQIDQAEDARSDLVAASKSAFEELSAKVGQPQERSRRAADRIAASCAQSIFAVIGDIFRRATVEEGVQSAVAQLESIQPLCTSVLGGTG